MYLPMRTMVLFSIALIMAGCSNTSSTNSGNINGNWSASLNETPTGPAVYSFSMNITQANAGTLNISNFTFKTTGPCFSGESTTQAGNFSLAGNFNGDVTGTFGMTVSTAFPGGATQNVLTLSNGTVSGNTIAGTWTLSGVPGCNGQGTFTINKT